MALKNRRMFELRLGKAGLTLFIIGMSILLFSGFLIGVVVGKHMEAYPEQYAFGMMGLIRDRLIAVSPKAVKKDAGDVEEEAFNLTFYDTLGGKKEGAAQGSRSSDAKNKVPDIPAGQVAPSAKKPIKESPVEPPGQVVSETHPQALPGEGGLKRQPPLTEGPVGDAGAKNSPPSPSATAQQVKTPPPAGSGRFEIQAAAYREERQAERLAKKFTALGFTSHVVVKDFAEKGRWFRVIVGGFESREKAQEASERIVAKFRGLKCVIRASGRSEKENVREPD
jgi:cell division septation protein DedD